MVRNYIIIYLFCQDIHDSCEPAMFSLEQLLFSIASDVRTSTDILETILPMIVEVFERESIDLAEIKVKLSNSNAINAKTGKQTCTNFILFFDSRPLGCSEWRKLLQNQRNHKPRRTNVIYAVQIYTFRGFKPMTITSTVCSMP